MFSKFEFKAGKYDNMTTSVEDLNLVKYYSLKMALDGKKLSGNVLSTLLLMESSKKE